MKPDGFKQKQESLWKWKREPKSNASVVIKNHIHIINVIANCAVHSEYARIQGRKLISEKDIIISLKSTTTVFILKQVYLRLYYALYIYQNNVEENKSQVPEGFDEVLGVIDADLNKFPNFAASYNKKKHNTIIKNDEPLNENGTEAKTENDNSVETRELKEIIVNRNIKREDNSECVISEM